MKNKYMFKTFLTCVFAMMIISLSAQHTVTGKVMEGDEELIGVTVVEQGNETNGTITDFDGTYEINVSSPTSTLIFSYVGMETQNVPIDTRASINIEMGTAAQYFDEVVVVGYGNKKRSSISGSVATLSSDEISETPVLRVEQALQGRSAGIQITQNSGSPGAALTVRVRGLGTVNNSDPLYIVDGIAVADLEFLNPNDVESISVLKDAASAAIYGSRAANGVVLVKTKSGAGANQEAKISYESYYGIQKASKKIDLLNAREYAVIQNEQDINAGVAPRINLEDPSIFNEGTDWQEAIFESAPIQSHQISMNGGAEGFNIGLSGNYFKQEGIVGGPKSSFERKTVRAVAGYQVKDWLNVGTNLGFTNLTRSALVENNQFDSPIIQALNMDPLTPVLKPDGTYAYSDFIDTDIRNPVNNIANTHGGWTTNRLVGAVYGTIDFTPKLKLKSTYSLDVNFAQERGFRPTWNLAVDSTDTPPTPEVNLTNSVGINDWIFRSSQLENVLTYTDNIGENHSFTALGGISYIDGGIEFNGSSNTGLPSNDPEDAYINNTIDSGTRGASQWAVENVLFSAFGRIDYEYKNKYVAMVSFRADGSSRFGPSNRFGYFPAASLAWVVSREDFFDVNAISLLKFRASWGQNGNDRIGDYQWSTNVNGGQNYTFGPDETITNGVVALQIANSELRWETSIQTNFGVDLELFDGKINFIGDYFIKETVDMLHNPPIPGVVGAFAPTRNIGTVDNRGVELALNYRNRDRAFKYELGGNVSIIKNEVTFLGGDAPIFSGAIFGDVVAKTDVGQPIASFFGWHTDGLFQNEEEIAAANADARTTALANDPSLTADDLEDIFFQSDETAPGDFRYVDFNGDGIIDNNDKTYLGNPTPDFTFGITGSAEFKSFDLSFFVQGVSGNEVYNASTRFDKLEGNKPARVLDRWTGEGTSDFEPRLSRANPNNNYRVSDYFIEDGSYLRIKNVQIGYNLPNALLDRMKFSKFRIYGSVQNLWTFTNYSGYDPEIGRTQDVQFAPLDIGIDRGFFPQSRTILGGIQVTF